MHAVIWIEDQQQTTFAMFAAQPERTAVAQQLQECLTAYKTDLDQWMAKPGDLDLYQSVSDRLDTIRALGSSALPSLTGVLADVVISQADVITLALRKYLLRGEASGVTQELIDRLREAHYAHSLAVESMQRVCLRLSQ